MNVFPIWEYGSCIISDTLASVSNFLLTCTCPFLMSAGVLADKRPRRLPQTILPEALAQ